MRLQNRLLKWAWESADGVMQLVIHRKEVPYVQKEMHDELIKDDYFTM